MGLNTKDYHDTATVVSQVLGAPPMEGFLVVAMIDRNLKTAILSKWFNSVAATE